MNNVNVLILSDSEDFTSDLVCIELHRQGVSYLRIDRDLINSYDISWQLSGNLIITNIETNETFSISKEELSGVYFRAPTYFRETFTTSVTPEIQLKRSQALSMFRNIEYFGQAKWMNAPSRTFFAENKVIQLLYAKEMGFNIPETEITNGNEPKSSHQEYIAKSIDTALFDFGESEAFSYAEIVSKGDLKKYDNRAAPYFIQEYLSDKIDLRVTVIGDMAYACEILEDSQGITGDWRLRKNNVKFISIELPDDIRRMCIDITAKFGLMFSGIDLIRRKGRYYFVELNPTGEWAWLVDSCGFKIQQRICECLL